MSRKFVFIFCVLSTVCHVFAQEGTYPRDTSYTLQSAFEKYVNIYPHITKVRALSSENVNVINGLVYKTIGNRELKLDVFNPKGNGKEQTPAIIMVHGGGWISGDKTLLHPMAIWLAEHGFVTITVEYRLSPEAQYPAAVEDITESVSWVKQHAERYGIDSSKVAILGTSAGGQLAALVGTLEGSEKVQAVIDVDGVLAFIHPVSEEGRVAGLWLGGNSDDKKEIWIQASALTHAGAKTPPVLFLGSSYPRFLAGHEEMMQMLSENGVYSELHRFEDAPHSFWLFNPWFTPSMEYIVRFLNVILE